MSPRLPAAVAVLLMLSGCGSGGPDATGATASESRQLNDAAAMLDANSVDANAVESDTDDQEQQ